MKDAVSNLPQVRTRNIAGRHARLGPPLRGFGALERVEPDESPAGAATGGIHASANEIVPWLQAQVGRGALPSGRRLWSEAQATEMWTPQVITAVGPGPTVDAPARSVMAGYALGWFVQEFRDRRLIHHAGGLSGQITYTGLFPESGHAFAVFTNTEDGAVSGLRNAIVDHLIGAPSFDWVGSTRTRIERQRAEALEQVGADLDRAPPGSPSLPLASYAGSYRDAWYGDLVVTRRGKGLHLDFTRTPVFKSMLEPFGPDTFRTRFPRGAGEDAVVTFVVENGRVARLKLKALSPLADFSFDFHDLNPVRLDD
jgi:CubicO group peptidase (beta-lactamase class C family)